MGKFFRQGREELILYVKQKAWFSAVPSAKGGKGRKKETPTTRYKQSLARGGTPLLPDPGPLAYLLRYWDEVGTAVAGGMASAPITAEELLAWQNGTQTPLLPVEFQVLLDISREFVAFLRLAEDPVCPPPYGELPTQVDRVRLSNRLGAAFKALASKGK